MRRVAMADPRVSVVIPVRNEVAFIAATIDSILAQDYDDAIEIIVADGMSDDGTRLERRIDVVYGSPGKPMTRVAHLDKFRRNCAASAEPIGAGQVEAAIAAVDELEGCTSVRGLLDLLSPERETGAC